VLDVVSRNKAWRRATSDLLRAPKALELSEISRMRVIGVTGGARPPEATGGQQQPFILSAMLIPENPYRGLLDDEVATDSVSKQLSTWTALLRDLANYGSNIAPAVSMKPTYRGKVVLECFAFARVKFCCQPVECILGQLSCSIVCHAGPPVVIKSDQTGSLALQEKICG